MTVRDLLSHRSGLSRGDLLWYASPFERDEVVHRVRDLEPVWSFRSRYGYQNIMFTTAGEIVDHGGVRIIGYRNVPGRLPVDSSALYARNLFNFIAPFVDGESGAIAIDWEDELVTGTALTRGGSVVHPLLVGNANQGGDR